MKKYYLRLIIVIFSFLFNSNALGQVISNQGAEFWAVFPSHVSDIDKNLDLLLPNFSIFITGSQASSGTVSVGGFTKSFTVAANSVTEIQVPREYAYINDTEASMVLSGRAIHIVVDPGQPKVVVYGHIFAGQRSAASLILPKDALGKQYFSMNYQQSDGDGKNFIALVATEPNTRIHIKKGNTELIPGGITLDHVNDAYEYLSDSDLSGVSVSVDTLYSACNHFAMFSGSSGVGISAGSCVAKTIDPLFQQCYPVESWGLNYGFIPFSTTSPSLNVPVRTAGQYVRIVAKEASTRVSINSKPVAVLNPGEFYTSPQPLTAPAFISSDKPVSVAQYALSQACSNAASDPNVGYSDPDMVILNPIEYNINGITIYSSKRENISEQYINVLIKTAFAPSFTINGNAPATSFMPMKVLPGYSYMQLNLNKDSTNTFNLKADSGFNAIAYGFGDVESYSYSAGTNLAALKSLAAIRVADGAAVDSICIDDSYFFKLTLPFISPRISWQKDAKESPIIQLNPDYKKTTVGGQPAYEYTLNEKSAYETDSGLHQLHVEADYPPSSNNCDIGFQSVDGLFKTIPLPAVSFEMKPELCSNIIDFTDHSTAGDNKIMSWAWDFGDNNAGSDANTSTVQNPSHVYLRGGKYQVKLLVVSAGGCQNLKIDTVIIPPKVQVGFTVSKLCLESVIAFTDTTKSSTVKTSFRKWYFGDGDSLMWMPVRLIMYINMREITR